jgi:DNA-3-methyladenine glycosylase II
MSHTFADPTAPAFWKSACTELSRNDPVMGSIIAQHQGSFLVSRGDVFTTLARAIVGQQISVKAAASVWGRFLAVVHPLSPQTLAQRDAQDLVGCGLSTRKQEYLLGLAQHFAQRPTLQSELHTMPDEQVIDTLTQIRGIGRWTAEMVLIFALLRPDVLPLADLGLMKAISRHYRAGEDLTVRQAQDIATVWMPWRSVATWYLWRSLDPEPVEY